MTTALLQALTDQAWKASPASTAVRWSGGEWQRAAHLQIMSDKIAEMWERPIRLIISLPPRHGKSELVSHWTPVNTLSVDPSYRVGLGSYAADLATLYSRKVRGTLAATPGLGVSLSTERATASDWETTEGGGMMAAGVGGPFTGRGFNLLIIDDPIKNQVEADSPTIRARVWEWYRRVARTRLEPNGSVIVIMTRWHEGDLVGKLTGPRDDGEEDSEYADEWEHIRLPALAEDDDPLGREEGEALWPDRYTANDLKGLRVDLGPQGFAALFQQRPTSQGGSVFISDWWRIEPELPEPKRGVIQFWDTAFKKNQENDYNACATMYDAAPDYVLLDMFRRRMEFPALVRAVISQAERFRPTRIYVEDAASGQSLVQTANDPSLMNALQRDAPRLPIVPVPVDRDKVARANAVTGYIEARQVILPAGAPWLPMFLGEATEFPRGDFDDMVDCFVGGLEQLVSRHRGRGGIMVWDGKGYRNV